ncbi:MAG TPA: TetR family transcriptional regulator, partial [Alcanivorax sp.]|nr:TetR family transcriptional regulator [Alcanivorax sp.]
MCTVSTSSKSGPSDRYHHGDLRRALVDEALVLLAESGDGGFSLRELARRVGVTANASYRHFANKDALLQALAAEGFRRLSAAQREAEAQVEGDETLLAGGRSYIRFAHANPALFRLMFSVIPPHRRDDELREASRAAFETLRQAVARGWPGGEPDPDSVTRAALRAWALVHGLGQLLLDGQLDWLEEDP